MNPTFSPLSILDRALTDSIEYSAKSLTTIVREPAAPTLKSSFLEFFALYKVYKYAEENNPMNIQNRLFGSEDMLGSSNRELYLGHLLTNNESKRIRGSLAFIIGMSLLGEEEFVPCLNILRKTF